MRTKGDEVMESIEKLRTVARNMAKGRNLENHEECNLLLIIANEIEREIADKYTELPVDADGVPIRVGEDVVRTNDHLQPETVRVIGVNGGSVFFKHEGRVKQNVAHNLHHVKPRTLESVLADLANEVWEASCTCQTTWSDSGLDGIEKKYAAEIRAMLGEVDR